MPKITRALLSVTDKTGLVDLARGLAELGVEILSTGGTAKLLAENGIPVTAVSDFTGSPEILGGRVKTLHPKVHGGLLGVRDNPTHRREMQENDILPIDMLICNLYAFEETIARPDCSLEEAIENIDIGGPAMLRSSAKNHRYVTVITNPADYASVLEEMRSNGGSVSVATNARLARQVFQLTAHYDGAIADYLGRRGDDGALNTFGATLHLSLSLEQVLRYGENPHQKAALYGAFHQVAKQLHGKELSFNNILDISCAILLMQDFLGDDSPVVSIAKHTTPCGVALAPSLREAFERAFQSDPDSPFGGIVTTNRIWDLALAQRVSEIFTEVLIAPEFTPEALAFLKKKRDRRLIQWNPAAMSRTELSLRGVVGGLLVQELDVAMENPRECTVVTKRQPTDAEYDALTFAWKVAKHARSNAVVFADPFRTLAIGSGSPARVDAVLLAREKAARVGISLAGSGLGSEAFFPFPDGIKQAAEAGATAVIQPGGSVRDEEVIAKADEFNLAMIFTGVRHFRH